MGHLQPLQDLQPQDQNNNNVLLQEDYHQMVDSLHLNIFHLGEDEVDIFFHQVHQVQIHQVL